MSAVLEFTLGLATSKFLGPLEEARGKILGFIGGLVSLEKVTEGVKGAFEQGAGLNELAKRTGQSVSDLYKLQRGFTSAGLSADSVGAVLYHMNRALGGVNEMGERTHDVFSRLGLRIEDLRSLSSSNAIQRIVGAMQQLNQSSASQVAAGIFGREGAQSMLQLAHSGREFAEGIEHAAAQARIFQRSAGGFEQVERMATQIKQDFKGVFVGLAEGLGPAIQQIQRMLGNIDLTGLGAGIGKYLTALTQAFSEGKLTELIALTLKTGFELAVVAAPAIFEKLGFILLKVFETPLNYLQAAMQFAVDQMANNPVVRLLQTAGGPAGPLVSAALDKLGVTSGKTTSFAEIFAEQQKKGLGFDVGSGGFGLGGINEDADARLTAFRERMKDLTKPLITMVDALAARAPHLAAGETSRTGTGTPLLEAFRHKPTDLEKMGFVMRGASLGADPAAQTARNTAKTNEKLDKVIEKLSLRGGASPLINDHA